VVGRAGVVWQAPAVALFFLFPQPGGEFLFVLILLGSDPALWRVEARFRIKADQIRRSSRLQKITKRLEEEGKKPSIGRQNL
jgi:hypothetical protein